ncbi:polysaccharide biosynthesis protein [Alteromonas sediminis]|uniref:Polysaccharide biosynthesis protein n=1 Tax=Alteromonas sediminis TaxID=2259342 RepID=A0A3N5Y4Q3_9ALTE|nr:oligosaccharide flippase family protein [Alteromonas sediminis]RPJ68580.1 polysaccharide biosynthesis protein [Alteromonas sediminis]
MIHLSKAIQQNAFYALGIVTMKSISLFMLPFVAHALSTEDYGRMELLTSFGAIGAIIVGFGLLNTLFRFAGDMNDKASAQQVAAEIFGINVMVGAVTLLVGLLFSDALDSIIPGELGQYNIKIMVGIIAIEGCIAIPLGWLRMTDKAATFFIVSLLRALLQASLTVLFLKQDKGLTGVMEAGLIAALIQACVLFVIQIKQSGIVFLSNRARGLLIYSYPMVGSGLLGFVLSGLDRWLLTGHMGTAEMATYAMAAKFAMIAALLLQPYLMWWSPRRFQVLNHENGIKKAAQFAALGSVFSMCIAVMVGLIAPILIEFLLPQRYWTASQYVPWLVILVVIKDSAELLNLGCYTGKSTQAQFLINLCGSVFGLVGMWLLIPWFGIWGAIAALITAQLIRLVLYLLISQKNLYLPYPSRRLLLFALVAFSLLIMGTEVQGLLEKTASMIIAFTIMLVALIKSRLLPQRALLVAK